MNAPPEAKATTKRLMLLVALVAACGRPRLLAACALPLITAQLRLPGTPTVVDDSSSPANRRRNREAARDFEVQGGTPTIVVAHRHERVCRQPDRRIQA